MEKTLKFNSQIATSRVQSERLLALGLKKETADMGWQIITINGETVEMKTEDNWERQEVVKNHFPAWSLHRLLSILPKYLEIGKDNYYDFVVRKGEMEITNDLDDVYKFFDEKDNVYDNIIDCIEWLIKEGYFNKEYLV